MQGALGHPRASARSGGPRCSPRPRSSTEVTSARTPGRSGTGTWSTATPAFTCGLAASDSRACLGRRRTRPRPPPGTPSRRGRAAARGARRTGRSPRTMASRFASRMSPHRRGLEAARRVRSRNPPAARSRISGSPASSVAARPMRAVEATCGQVAHHGDEAVVAIGVHPHRAGPDPDDPGLEARDRPLRPRPTSARGPTRCRRGRRVRRGPGPSARSHPSDARRRSGAGPRRANDARPRPSRETSRSPTSVTTASGARRRTSATSSGTDGIGVHTNTRVASADARPRGSRPPRTRSARRRGAGRPGRYRTRAPVAGPRGGHRDRGADQAGPDDGDPLSRGRHGATPRRRGRRARPRPAPGACGSACRMRTTPGIEPSTGISWAHMSGHRAEPHPPGGLRRERRAQVMGHGEEDAHDIARLDVVALQHRSEETLGGSQEGRRPSPRARGSRRVPLAPSSPSRLPHSRSADVRPGDRLQAERRRRSPWRHMPAAR